MKRLWCVVPEKYCSGCRRNHSLHWFTQPTDSTCVRARAWCRKAKLKQKFGISPEEYEVLVRKFGGRCGICGADDPQTEAGSWPIDHDHTTGQVRGILCLTCNRKLAWVDRHEVAIFRYLAGEVPIHIEQNTDRPSGQEE